MDATTLAALALYALATSATPGPNNLMLATSGLNFGLRGSIGSLLGIEAGFLALILLVGAGLAPFFAEGSTAHIVLKGVGAAYLLWLAWKLWTAGELAEGGGEARAIGFWRGALFQAVNPKGWMMAVGAVGAFAPAGEAFWAGLLAIVLMFALVGIPCLLGWTMFGAAMRRLLRSRRAFLWFNRTMAGLTALTVLLVVT